MTSVSRRTLLAIGVASLALATLTGCTKPAPGATVFTGTQSAHREATCWAFNADTLGEGECAQELIAQAASGDGVSSLKVIPGDTVGISVEPVVAETGWFPVVGNQRLTAEPITETYFRFTFPELQEIPAEGLLLQVVAGQGSNTRGIWVFKLDAA